MHIKCCAKSPRKSDSTGFVIQYACAFGLDVVKLPPVNGPPQTTQNEKNQADRQGNKQVENVQSGLRKLGLQALGLSKRAQVVWQRGLRAGYAPRALRLGAREHLPDAPNALH